MHQPCTFWTSSCNIKIKSERVSNSELLLAQHRREIKDSSLLYFHTNVGGSANYL
jgi:hypothetical protein